MAGKPQKNLAYSILLDFYGPVLTEKQRVILTEYYNEDLSLAEIAENLGITRQGVRSGMLTVYDYFYNAGGMDDYPPQVAMHRQHLDDRLAPVCSSVHFIRIAKIMAQTARYYGFEADVQEMEEDIRRVSQALLDNAWDPESGYFGYVLHNPEGTEIFRTPEGENYNKGVDGVTPLIAGVCTPAQEERMLDHLKTEGEHQWNPVCSNGIFYV